MIVTFALICALLAGCTAAAPRSAPVQPAQSGAPQFVSGPVASHPAGRANTVSASSPATRGGAPLTLAGGTTNASSPAQPGSDAASAPGYPGSDAAPVPPAVSHGTASWFAARGYQGAVPWWKAGQQPVWATVSRFADGKTYSVTVLVTGFCACLAGQPGERLIDLSPAAFRQLGVSLSVGLIRVTMTVPVQGPRLPATDAEAVQ